MSPHVCLLARATALATSLPPSAAPDPINDPRWAQLNLNAVIVPSGEAAFDFELWAGNSSAEPVTYGIVARPANEVALEALTAFTQTRAVFTPDTKVRIAEVDAESNEGSRLQIELGPSESRRLRLTGHLAAPIADGTFTAVEVEQYDLRQERVTGSLGIVLQPGG
jgi:hypothetical protein